ncbi:MAG: homoserine dehydrogenase [Piscirickettsiaceae bacterium CG_4_9_14_3_um_filter_43_564]|nr:MAG: homoserine dehydrogenase [Piscirickettsiaceae bacterium CG18_big_fil_WC_8_21_14_2_50_44_103]PIW58420.1 MAG: homoserine dehydrogenase [Piscirickettsiaceae bacterium CG12_big_fil_rev_8_21_14_0_65_44_934]PIW78708.1 MAG: homoserine dehydrogenase [Piscirickettsiaceae bacterium CG_4_8_14_3_um_filter_44_38]PIX79253.1 MAG: homoserine dehydrogenase [Piscirickettsiaceae bacterium CG_4_10_14_3_um_filter_44_349]PIY76625.1 MAG: homoserine dehydrogenase [Piscirickettsiaceae bacterium CG_4_10_14_0_8_u
MKQVRIGLLGFGTVGGGTATILNQTLKTIERRLNGQITLKIEQVAVRDLSRSREADVDKLSFTDSAMEVVENPQVDIVVELMGGTTIAKQCIERAIELGKPVVTANKALIAEQGNQLFKLAEQKAVPIAYEAAVAGGIPIIKALREGLSANQIEWVAGIINGTGNYILTEMKKPGADFSEVLKTAQALGYAEADPTFDVEGIDAAHKLTIMASIAFGIPLQFEKVYTEGISQVTAEDIQFAKQLGYEIKHLGIASRSDNGYSLRVHPTLIPDSVLIAQVNGVMNAVMVSGNHVGSTLYYGPGAGAGPTASAVVADIVDLVRGLHQPPDDRVPALGFGLDQLETASVIDIDAITTAFYLRFFVKDNAGVLAKVTSILARFNINIELLHQEPSNQNPDDATLVMITNAVPESDFNAAVRALESLDSIDGKIARIRVDALD